MAVSDALALCLGRRLPIVLQSEAAECGLACLAMISRYHGRPAEMSDLRRRFALSLRGATLADVIKRAGELGLASRPLRLELEELPELRTPCILHWDLNHFVVLQSASRRRIVIHDPAVGVRRMTLSEASKHFTGVALECSPTEAFERAAPAPRVRLRALLGPIVGLHGSLLQLFLLALAIELLAVASPFFIQWVVDDVLVAPDPELLTTLVAGFALLLVVRVAVSAMRGWMLMALGTSLKLDGRANLFSHLVRLPASYFEARYLADVVSRFGSQETILHAITTDAVEAVLDGLLAAITGVVMFLVAPTLGALVLAGAVLHGLLRWIAYAPLRQASSEAIVWAARRDSHFLETLRGVKTIKLFNAEEARAGRWLNLLVETLNRQLTTQKLQLGLKATSSLLTGGLAIAVVWLGARAALDGALSVGMLLAFIAYKDQFLERVGGLVNKALDWRILQIHSERLADIALSEPERREAGGELVLHPRVARPPTIELKDVRFRYGENEPWLLDGLNMTIESGESVAIVGDSGAGKTTLLKLLASLLEPTSGEILIDGKPIGTVGIRRYRSMLGVVMQDDQLFAGSIADNITFFSETPDLERIQACAELAAVHDDITAMPMGYGTLIGDMGTVLSGGQKQRVLIARALYRRPTILLLDEATSYLDVARERAVNAALAAFGITRVIVAHRPETIRSAGRVVPLERGKLALASLPSLPLAAAG